jgi:hypothetical protein
MQYCFLYSTGGHFGKTCLISNGNQQDNFPDRLSLLDPYEIDNLNTIWL